MSITHLKGKCTPDRKFSIGIAPAKKVKTVEKDYDHKWEQQEEPDYGAIAEWLEGKTNVLGKFCSTSECPDGKPVLTQNPDSSDEELGLLRSMDNIEKTDWSDFYDYIADDASPLFIKSPKSSRKPRGNYGTHGITGYGRKVVSNTAILLERRFTKKRLGFVTCTLPSYNRATHRYLLGKWGECVRRFYQKLKRQLEKIHRPFVYVGVTEIQEKRFRDSGIAAPHLHFVYLCRDYSSRRYWLYVCQIHRAWNESIEECLHGCDHHDSRVKFSKVGSVHCKRVQKSASAYLGKYISKGCGVLDAMKANGYEEFPKQWWTASAIAKRMYANSVVQLCPHVCSAFFYNLAEYLHEGVITWASFVWVNIGGEERRVGLVGTLAPGVYEMFRDT